MTKRCNGSVSVLLPVAPRATWLEHALRGLERQTLDSFEVVVVMDGDCDQNLAALRSSRLGSRLTITRTGGGAGIARALNLGLEACSGDLVARHDADDVSASERLEVQAEVMQRRREVVVLGTSARTIDEAGTVTGHRDAPSGAKLIRTLLWRSALIHPSVMMRASVIRSLGGYNEDSIRTEDFELWLRASCCGTLDNLPARLLDYRVHGAQHSRGRVLGAQSRALRQARRRAARCHGGSAFGADARHAAWVTVQRLKGRG